MINVSDGKRTKIKILEVIKNGNINKPEGIIPTKFASVLILQKP